MLWALSWLLTADGWQPIFNLKVTRPCASTRDCASSNLSDISCIDCLPHESDRIIKPDIKATNDIMTNNFLMYVIISLVFTSTNRTSHSRRFSTIRKSPARLYFLFQDVLSMLYYSFYQQNVSNMAVCPYFLFRHLYKRRSLNQKNST